MKEWPRKLFRGGGEKKGPKTVITTVHHTVITESQFALKYCYLQWQVYRINDFSGSKICELLAEIQIY